MADQATAPATDAATDTAAKADDTKTTTPVASTAPADIEAIAAQAKDPDAVRNALNAERQAAKEATTKAAELAAKVKEFEDRDKSEQEKLEERATTAETAAETAHSKLLRFEVAVAKKLPLELADRLQGKDKKELEADADRLLELVKPNGDATGDADAGKGTVAAGTSFNDLVRARATGR